MDTREKIIAIENVVDATTDGMWSIVAGHFDPLTAENAAYIAQVAAQEPNRRVLVLILPSESYHLTAAARAALVAALRVVDLVSVGSLTDLPDHRTNMKVFSDASLDQQHSRNFVDLVVERQKADS